MEMVERFVEEDLQQAATVVASFVCHAANREEILPRLDRLAVWILSQGADRHPPPPRRGVRTLKGKKTGRLV